MSDYPVVKDYKDRVIRIGDLVNTSAEVEFEAMSRAERIRLTERWNWDVAPEGSRERHHAAIYRRMPDGIVVSISDFDGDVDDEGQGIGINPYVYVQWPGEDEPEKFHTTIISYANAYYSDDWEVEADDLVVLKRDYSNERGESTIEIYIDVLIGVREGRTDNERSCLHRHHRYSGRS